VPLLEAFRLRYLGGVVVSHRTITSLSLAEQPHCW